MLDKRSTTLIYIKITRIKDFLYLYNSLPYRNTMAAYYVYYI